jgi:glycosyltransferase involved in cell wall biosynthesis
MHVVVATHHRLPVEGYGGTQRVVAALVRGLAAHGHRVTLIAQPGTKIPEAAKIVEVQPRKLHDADLASFVPDGADVLHAHFVMKRSPNGVPFLQTLHGNLKAGAAPPPHNVFLSRDHARRYGSTTFVYNGLDPREFFLRKRKENWDLFLGRLHSAKGYQWAVEAAKRTGRRLIVAGGWRPTFSGPVKYVGEVDGGRKRALLARARCLWMPAQWDEPFGLTTIEALFSGTPVLATRRGALPEVLTPAVGAFADTLDAMIKAAESIARDPVQCRSHAERYFSHLVMAQEYVRMYEGVMANGQLPEGRATPWS